MATKQKSLESNLIRLEEIINVLDSGDSTIEEMLVLYEEGIRLVQYSREFLDKAEMRVINLSKSDKTEKVSIMNNEEED